MMNFEPNLESTPAITSRDTSYVGEANNLRARLRKHEPDHEPVSSWISFFDEHFELLNVRLKKAARCKDAKSLDKICSIIGWPLSLIDSTQAIDCCYDIV